ncbi:MAG: 3-methyl-2-oxobutanoate dehydrogenase subunit beta, partial [Sedimentisphaerales bacterium]|nr:3-methyl-2-oxobutanoate dehydrogenase subunit beta [Sedimentisphaerales bacterium]
GGGHGDYKTFVLGPASVQEMADCMPLAFDLADQYRMPAIILADGILGQMMEPLVLDPKPRRELPAKDWALTGAKGREQNIVRSLWLGDGVLEELNRKLQARYREIEGKEVLCEEYLLDDAEIVLVAYGIVARIARAAVVKAREEGIPVGMIRPITLWPFPSQQISRAAEQFRVFLTLEMSSGQMLQDVQLAVAGKAPVLFYGRMGGGVPTVDEVLEKIKELTVSHKA